jgi:hypothetical protein
MVTSAFQLSKSKQNCKTEKRFLCSWTYPHFTPEDMVTMLLIERLPTLLLLLCHLAGRVMAVDLLMVGNSYTSVNDLPTLVKSLLQENADNDPVGAYRYTVDAQYLVAHRDEALGFSGEDNQLRKWLVTEPKNWTWVVLQEQSLVGSWVDAFAQWDYSRDAAVQLNQMIASTGGATIFFMTWGRRDGFDSQMPDFLSMNKRLDIGYHRYAQATSTPERPTRVAPVGLAFQRVYEQNVLDGIDPLTSGADFHKLYGADGSHPSLQGSYLAACVLYATMTGRDPRLLVFAPEGIDTATKTRLQAVAFLTMVDEANATNSPTSSPTDTATGTPIVKVSFPPAQSPSTQPSLSSNTQLSQFASTGPPFAKPSESPSSHSSQKIPSNQPSSLSSQSPSEQPSLVSDGPSISPSASQSQTLFAGGTDSSSTSASQRESMHPSGFHSRNPSEIHLLSNAPAASPTSSENNAVPSTSMSNAFRQSWVLFFNLISSIIVLAYV